MFRNALVVMVMLAPGVGRAEVADAPVMPLGESATLPPSAAANEVNDSFMGSIGVSAELTMLAVRRAPEEMDNGTTLRGCGTLRLGPFVACVGFHKHGDSTKLNLALDMISFQHNGWAVAMGYGTLDGTNLRFAIPLTVFAVPKLIRLRLMASYGGIAITSKGDFTGPISAGGGLEVDVW